MRSIVLTTVAFAALTVSAMAADISLTFSNTTPTETRAAQWKLAQVNEVRVAHELEPFADIKAYINDIIKNRLLPQWIAQQAEAQKQTDDIKTLWKDATAAQRTAAKAALTK